MNRSTGSRTTTRCGCAISCDAVGYYDTGSIDTDIREFNNAQRLKYDADWAFTIFVANDLQRPDWPFPPGGSFSRAFAFSGGRFLVSPSRRPPSTFAHETGHMFYAMDEYNPAGSYRQSARLLRRPESELVGQSRSELRHQTSIMDNNATLQTAWQNHTSSDASLAMIGWQDSDADGVFDVLDVPLALTGTGRYDAAAGSIGSPGIPPSRRCRI